MISKNVYVVCNNTKCLWNVEVVGKAGTIRGCGRSDIFIDNGKCGHNTEDK